jgi:hypothetical protein
LKIGNLAKVTNHQQNQEAEESEPLKAISQTKSFALVQLMQTTSIGQYVDLLFTFF